MPEADPPLAAFRSVLFLESPFEADVAGILEFDKRWKNPPPFAKGGQSGILPPEVDMEYSPAIRLRWIGL